MRLLPTILNGLLETLDLGPVVVAGQSWGGNVVLNFGARFPQAAQALVFVDGGFLNLKGRGTWEQVSTELRPPNLTGIPRQHLAERIAGDAASELAAGGCRSHAEQF